MNRIYRALYNFFWRTCCICPDRPPGLVTTFVGRWNYWTGRAANYFHRKHCDICRGRR